MTINNTHICTHRLGGYPILQSSEAITRSQHRAMSLPPATAESIVTADGHEAELEATTLQAQGTRLDMP